MSCDISLQMGKTAQTALWHQDDDMRFRPVQTARLRC